MDVLDLYYMANPFCCFLLLELQWTRKAFWKARMAGYWKPVQASDCVKYME